MRRFKELLPSIKAIGFRSTLNTVRYSVYRDRLSKKFGQEWVDTFQIPGHLLSFTPNDTGASAIFESVLLDITFIKADIIRLSWRLKQTSADQEIIPYAVQNTSWIENTPSLSSESGRYTISSPVLTIAISEEGALEFNNSEGALLRRELPPLWNGNSSTHIVELKPEECLYGLGEHTGSLNLRGQSHRLWNSDPGGSYGINSDPIYAPFPVYSSAHSLGSYLLFYENTYPADVRCDPDNKIEPRLTFNFLDGPLCYYIIPGAAAHTFQLFSALTGRPPLPPRWSLGYHQSRWGYKTEEDIRQVVDGFIDRDLPISAIHLDIDYMDGYRVFTVDRSRFPDLKQLTSELNDKNIKTVAIIDPGVKVDLEYELYRDGIEKNVFCRLPDGSVFTGLVWPGWCVYPDFTNPFTRRWWGRFYTRLLNDGIAGIWHDMNEPTSFSAWGGLDFPEAVMHDLEGQLGNHHKAHNVYGLQMNRAGFKALRQLLPEQRPWLLSRSGWIGLQRYAWIWTGDIESTWDGLKMTVSCLLNLSISGIPFSGSDIGGFSGNPSPELFLRWFQMSTFAPFFRTHSAINSNNREPWVFGEPYESSIRDSLSLRYRLLPYLYTLAWEASQTGLPITRPLFWSQGDKLDLTHRKLWTTDDAFFLGEALLVAPITEEGARSREVCLPPGSWYSFWDDTIFIGSNSITVTTILNVIPVFASAGSVLPLDQGDDLVLHIYVHPNLGAAGQYPAKYSGRCYSDAGDGYLEWRMDHYHVTQKENELEIIWESEGDFSFPYRTCTIQLHGFVPGQAWIDGRSVDILKNNIVMRAPGKYVILRQSHDES